MSIIIIIYEQRSFSFPKYVYTPRAYQRERDRTKRQPNDLMAILCVTCIFEYFIRNLKKKNKKGENCCNRRRRQ